jgi:hypothetical protein
MIKYISSYQDALILSLHQTLFAGRFWEVGALIEMLTRGEAEIFGGGRGFGAGAGLTTL